MRKLFFLVLGLVLLMGQVFAQTRTVTGRVTDANGSPVPNVSVTVKGSSTGTTTASDGAFSLSLPADAKTLVFTGIGFASLEVAINNRTSFDVTLGQEDRNMQEVVVVGYGTQRKKDLTGNVASVKGSVIRDLPVQSFDQALAGRAAGVNATMPNGVLNNPPVIRVRGINSISLSSFPLIVIDGVPTFTGNFGGTASNNVLGDLNPNDVESIEILKDAAASAIYGSRAAAGVLLITTKKGRQGRPRVNYDGWVGWTSAFKLIETLNAQEYTDLKNEGLTNAGTPPDGTSRGFYTMNGPDGKMIDTRWYDYIYQTGMSQNHSVNVSGATDRTQYYISGGFTDQDGMIVKNSFKRFTTRLTLEQKVNSWFTLGGSLNYSNSKNAAPNTGSLPGQAFSIAGLGRQPLVMPPNVSPYNADGSYNVNGNAIGQGANKTAVPGYYNPVYIIDLNKFSSENDRILSNVYANIRFMQGLNFRTTFGIDNLNVVNKEYRNALHGDGVSLGGATQNTYSSNKRWNWSNVLQYDKTFGTNHNLNVLVGNEQQYTFAESWGADRRNQSDPFYDEYQGGYLTIVPAGNGYGENYLVSFFGRINYDFKKRYFLSLNGRRDGYSAFSPENKYGNFGGASVGWGISEESFWQNSSLARVINNFKIRGSYGVVGNNQGIDNYAFYSFFNSGLYGTQGTLFYSQAGNRNLKWESSTKLDLGFEMGLFNNRINLDFAYYNNDINNLILNNPQAPSVGIPGNSILTNIGRMVNSGIEVSVNANIIRTKDFSWNSNFNITTVKNEVKALAEGNSDIFVQTSGLETPSIIRVGESIGSFLAIMDGGVNPDNGQRILYYGDGTAVQYNHALTTNRWTYLDGTAAPRSPNQVTDGKIIGPALPKFFGGWDNTFRYKGIDFNIMLFFSGGNYVYNGTKAGLRDNRNWNNAKESLTRWQKPGDITNIPRIVYNDNVSNGSSMPLSQNVEKGDFIKGRNIALGYTLPRNIVEKISLSNIRFYAAVQNAFTITKYTGFDPETSTNGNANGSPSVDRNSVPQARTILFGLNVGF
ncbi:TonB-dependent receptor [Pollutibacter soli]|uniref:SusC/RagA family TonB-linked outer membrane protein n=1 Tax=Pollutibacter soli TaxID=3034157 RepID=UPI003013D588